MHLQIQSNWTFGEVLDENAKTHPMLRPYKTFSEKVREGFLKLFFFLVVGKVDLYCSRFFIVFFYTCFCILCCAG